MPEISLYCQVHQPYRLRRYRLFDIGAGAEYFDDETNRAILRRVAEKCYRPANRALLDLIRETDGAFRLAFSVSGTALEQLAMWAPEALESFQLLADTGRVEFLGETYYHSLAGLADQDEFAAQVRLHRQALTRHLGVLPTVFRNTELIFHDDLAPTIQALGFRGALVEGADHVLGWRAPNFVYDAAAAPGLRLLPRNYRLSDDIGFRFSNRDWAGWPLTADKHAAWLAASPGDTVHVFLDYETFGEHQWTDTGIFEFLRRWPHECLRRGLAFRQPTELAERHPVAPLEFPHPTSWADEDRGVTAWLGNPMQRAAHDRLYRVGEAVRETGDPGLLARWRRLTTSDHVYYMCTKWFNDGDVHKYFSPYATPYDAFVTFMNVCQDLEQAAAAIGRAAIVEPMSLRRERVAEMACVA